MGEWVSGVARWREEREVGGREKNVKAEGDMTKRQDFESFSVALVVMVENVDEVRLRTLCLRVCLCINKVEGRCMYSTIRVRLSISKSFFFSSFSL